MPLFLGYNHSMNQKNNRKAILYVSLVLITLIAIIKPSTSAALDIILNIGIIAILGYLVYGILGSPKNRGFYVLNRFVAAYGIALLALLLIYATGVFPALAAPAAGSIIGIILLGIPILGIASLAAVMVELRRKRR